MSMFHPFTFPWYLLRSSTNLCVKAKLFLYLVYMSFPPMRDFQFGWSCALRL